MRSFFNDRVNDIVELVQGQINQVGRLEKRVKVCIHHDIPSNKSNAVCPRTYFSWEDLAKAHIYKPSLQSLAVDARYS